MIANLRHESVGSRRKAGSRQILQICTYILLPRRFISDGTNDMIPGNQRNTSQTSPVILTASFLKQQKHNLLPHSQNTNIHPSPFKNFFLHNNHANLRYHLSKTWG